MLAWKCNCGICPSEPTNISQFIALDVNAPFVINTGNTSLPSSVSIYNTPTEAYDALKVVIGNDVNSLWKPVQTTTSSVEQEDLLSNMRGNMGNAFPSVPLGHPVSWENILQDTLLSVGYYFPKLARLLVSQDRSNITAVYAVESGGILNLLSKVGTQIDNPMGSPANYYPRNYMRVGGPYFNESLEPTYENLSNASNYKTFDITCRSTSYWYQIRYGMTAIADGTSKLFSALFSNTFVPPDYNIPSNPYEPVGPSGPGGGDGTFDDESDPIGIPSLPTLSSANTGFTRIYNPTLQQVQDLARYLWTDDSVIETIWNHIKQFFENPMDAIIGFNLVPVRVPDAGSKNFALMYIDTGVQMNVAANQFVDVDCGSFELKEYYGSALDYSPYTKISCFLPFIGTVSLNVDEVMARTLAVKYRVDICSGSCVAYITVDGNAIYQFSGHCAITIPLASADFSSYVNAAISVGKLIGAGFASGASASAAAAMGGGEVAQQTGRVVTKETTTTARNPVTGRQITTGTVKTTTTTQEPQSQSTTDASFMGMSPESIVNTVGQIMSSKPHIEHSGSFSGNSGYLGVRRPYLIIERPNLCMPEQYQTFNGFPAMMTLSLSECSGFTRIQQINPVGFSATNPELAEILQLLKAGVFL